MSDKIYVSASKLATDTLKSFVHSAIGQDKWFVPSYYDMATNTGYEPKHEHLLVIAPNQPVRSQMNGEDDWLDRPVFDVDVGRGNFDEMMKANNVLREVLIFVPYKKYIMAGRITFSYPKPDGDWKHSYGTIRFSMYDIFTADAEGIELASSLIHNFYTYCQDNEDDDMVFELSDHHMEHLDTYKTNMGIFTAVRGEVLQSFEDPKPNTENRRLLL